MGFFAEEDQPVIWRGPMLHKALEQFLTDVFWDEPDFLVVDLPPGTGDVSISLAQYLPRAEVYVVTTPQPRGPEGRPAGRLHGPKVNLEVKGVIENMSWFTGDDGKRYELFGAGGGQTLADLLEVPLLGQVPLVPRCARAATTASRSSPPTPTARRRKAFAEIARPHRRRAGPHPTRRHHELKLI